MLNSVENDSDSPRFISARPIREFIWISSLLCWARHSFSGKIFPAAIPAGLKKGHCGLADGSLVQAFVILLNDAVQSWNVQSLAKAYGMSRSKYTKSFHDVVAVTPADYRTGHIRHFRLVVKFLPVTFGKIRRGGQYAQSKLSALQFAIDDERGSPSGLPHAV